MILNRIKSPTATTDLAIQSYIQKIYTHHDHQISTRTSIAETSGEILLSGINKIIANIEIKHDDHFMDLGSGTGKVVLHVFMRTPVASSCGIEIVGNQYDYAHRISTRVKNEMPAHFHGNRKLQFINGDFLQEPFHHATIILIASPCFTPTMLDKISDIINHTNNIHTAISLRPLINLKRLGCQRVFNVECSWDSSLCYIYK